ADPMAVVRYLEGDDASLPSRGRRWRLLAAAAAVVVGAAAMVIVLKRPKPAPGGGAQTRPAVAVLGFKNLSGAPGAAWVSTGLAEMLTIELAAGERLDTVTGEDVVRVKADLGLPDAESHAKDTLAKIGALTGADYVIDGS